MIAPELPRGTVLPLSRRLDAAPDPLALYNKLTRGGAKKNTLFFETADAARGASVRSFLVEAAAVRATCRSRRVLVEALSDGGELALEAIAASFEGTGFINERAPRALALVFPRLDGRGDAEERLKAPSPLDVLRAMSTRLTVAGDGVSRAVFCAGVFSYDLVDTFEELPNAASDPLDYPDYVFWLAESLITIDGRTGQTQLFCPAFGSADRRRAAACYNDAAGRLARLVEQCAEPCAPPSRPIATIGGHDAEADLDDAGYAAAVVELKKRIVAGDVFQIVPSRTFRAPCPAPLAAYAELRRINPSPYMFYLAAEDHTLFGASPETCVKVSASVDEAGRRQRTLHICPIAGTRRRGREPGGGLDRDLDDRLEAELRLHDKEVAEHMMLVDLARNDVARVSRPGTRHVARLLSVERYSHVMHLASEVVGALRDDLDALHAYQASMNMGTLVGAPKVRAAELLREAEATKRGPYGGAVGYLDHAGELDSAIAIRSAVVKDGLAYVRAGAGVVYDSDPALEADETRRKAQAVLSAIRIAYGAGAPAAHPALHGAPKDTPGFGAAGAEGRPGGSTEPARDVIFIDNFDSFTFNLVEAFQRLGCRVRVFRNNVDPARVMELAGERASLIVISPGPGGPEDAGCCMELIARARGKVPLLGVCLGHQAMVKQAGGDVSGADRIVHGKASLIEHDGAGPFTGLPSPLLIGRYHSLATRRLPQRFRVHASLGDMAMAISDPVALQVGVQFHPESILTPLGDGLLRNILGQVAVEATAKVEPRGAEGTGS